MKAPALIPSTSIALAFALVSSQLYIDVAVPSDARVLTHLQFESAWQELEVSNFWQVFQVEKTPVRVSTPATDLTVASATSQRAGVPAEFQEHPLSPAQVPDEVWVAQVSACLPSAKMVCKSFAEPVIRSMKKLMNGMLHRPSSSLHSQVRPFALLQVDEVSNFWHATCSRMTKE